MSAPKKISMDNSNNRPFGMVDYHTHTARCGHAEGDARAFVEKAIEIGLSEIGFSDHLPLVTKRDPSLTMDESELEEYVKETQRLKSEYSEIAIKLGIEADFFPGLEEKTADILERYPFDYIIGSVHFLGGWGFDDPREKAGYEGKRPLEVYERYFETLTAAAESKLFDIIGHPDLIKKYNYRADGDIGRLYERAAEAIAAAGAAVEINTAGLRKPVKEIYPTLELLVLCREAGAPVSFGSDAHAPQEVGWAFDEAAELARAAGYKEMAVFSGRCLTKKPIPEVS